MSSEGAQRTHLRFWAAIEAAALAALAGYAVLFALTIPLGSGPDEEGHAAYVESLATGQGLPLPGESPSRRGAPTIITPQAHHPPLYYALLVPLYHLAPTREHFLLGGRAVSILLGLCGVLLVRAAGRRVGLQPAAVALGLIVLLALTTFTIIIGQLNNEALAVLVVCLSIYTCARFLEAGSARAATLVLGGVLGLALLSKLTATVAVFPLAAGVIAASRRAGPPQRWRARATGRLAVGLALAGAIAAPWFAHNLATRGALVYNSSYRPCYPDPLVILATGWPAVFVTAAVIEEDLAEIVFPNWLTRYYVPRVGLVYAAPDPQMLRPPWYDALMFLFWGAPLLGLIRGRRTGHPEAQHAWQLAGIVGLVVVGALLGVIYQALLVDNLVMRWAPRYTPVFLPSLALVLGMGWSALVPARARPAMAIVLFAGALTASAIALLAVAGQLS